MAKLLHRDAVRCEPYSDGPWFFAFDPAHGDALRSLGAYEALLGIGSGQAAESRLARIAEEGLAIACELGQDWLAVDVLVGKKLGAAQAKKAEWIDAQAGYLALPSGRLRIESLNSLSFGPDEPTDEGCEIEVPSGAYDVVVRRVAWELMDVESREERPEVPGVVLELQRVGKKGPKQKAASLTLSEALGDVGAWLGSGRVDEGAFHGTTRAHEHDASLLYLNLRGSQAERMGLRFGRTLELECEGARLAAPFIGYLSRRGVKGYFGADWYEERLGSSGPIAGFSPFQASSPWVVEVAGSGLPVDASIVARVGEPWCELDDLPEQHVHAADGGVRGRLAWVSPGTLILGFGSDALRRAGIESDATLELAVEGSAPRRVHASWSPGDLVALRKAVLGGGASVGIDEADALVASGMTHWDDPERTLIWLMPLVGDALRASPGPTLLYSFAPQPGDRHGLPVRVGSEVVLRAARDG